MVSHIFFFIFTPKIWGKFFQLDEHIVSDGLKPTTNQWLFSKLPLLSCQIKSLFFSNLPIISLAFLRKKINLRVAKKCTKRRCFFRTQTLNIWSIFQHLPEKKSTIHVRLSVLGRIFCGGLDIRNTLFHHPKWWRLCGDPPSLFSKLFGNYRMLPIFWMGWWKKKQLD